ncbi:undecaprenyldiphospho-muramoylpentapeptide beta-N-acetylglucosaminyltransferase [Candidatus Saganbacteria bacterium]|nr:undecaprenyldiphospho-muramoylpentapeptide beta-N-acetylglucosaminyltransferase [Candidatus Saganbacteria bacterium]
MKVLIAAGGTGGHIYPGIAIAEEIMSRDKANNVLFICGMTDLEKTLFDKEGFKFERIFARGIIRKISFQAASAPFAALVGFLQSIIIFLRFRPDRVVLTGGYVSFPVAIAARLFGIRLILQEQNVLPGIVSRMLSKISYGTALSYNASKKYINGIVTGNPVRQSIRGIKRKEAPGRNVLIVGGSQGARAINRAIISNIQMFENKNIELFHIIGQRDFADVLSFGIKTKYPFYHPIAYMYNIEECLKSCDLALSRAGATAISEFLAVGMPSILVPFPFASEGHQQLNAEEIKNAHAAEVLPEKDIARLPQLAIGLLDDPQKLREMSQNALRIARPDAAKKVVELLYE